MTNAIGLHSRIQQPVYCSAGSGELGSEVVPELQRFGVEVIALDAYSNAIAMQVADRSHVVSMLDGEALREIIFYEKPDLVVPEVEAIATDVCRIGSSRKNQNSSHCPCHATDYEP